MPTPASRNGVYGPNVPFWLDEHWDLLDQFRFRHVLVRADVDLSNVTQLRAKGLSVVHQLPDRWASYPDLTPEDGEYSLIDLIYQRAAPGELWVPDNEPNLLSRTSRWYPEQWVRYYRALWALWKWRDAAQEHPFILPALSPNDPASLALWEDVIDPRAEWVWPRGVHCYWQDEAGLERELTRLRGYADLAPIPGGQIYVLEYANTSPSATEEEKARQYVRFLTEAPDEVVACYLFILGGTKDWRAYWPSYTVLDALVGLED